MSVKLNFKISKAGTVELVVDGVQGTSCSDITRAFETELGVVTESQQLPDYYMALDQTKQYVGEGE